MKASTFQYGAADIKKYTDTKKPHLHEAFQKLKHFRLAS